MPRRARRGPGTRGPPCDPASIPEPDAGRAPPPARPRAPRDPTAIRQLAARRRSGRPPTPRRGGAAVRPGRCSRPRARAGERVPPPPPPRWACPWAWIDPASAHRRAGHPAGAWDRWMARCRPARRPRRSRRGRTTCCAAWPTRRPGPAPLRPQPRPGRTAATPVAGGRRTRAQPSSRSTGRGSRRTAEGRGTVRRARRHRAVADTIVGSRPTPIVDVRAPRARGPRRPGRRTRPPRSGWRSHQGRRGRCGPPPPPPPRSARVHSRGRRRQCRRAPSPLTHG